MGGLRAGSAPRPGRLALTCRRVDDTLPRGYAGPALPPGSTGAQAADVLAGGR
jgi:hypothetical protein